MTEPLDDGARQIDAGGCDQTQLQSHGYETPGGQRMVLVGLSEGEPMKPERERAECNHEGRRLTEWPATVSGQT